MCVTHGEEGQRLAGALQEAVHEVGVGRVQHLLQEGLLHHQLHQLLPPVHRLQHPQVGHHAHQEDKLFPRHVLQNLLCFCKDVVLHLLRHDLLCQGLQFGGQKLDGPFPNDVLSLQDLREETAKSTWRTTERRGCVNAV